MDHDSETLAAVHEAVKDMDKLNYRMQSMIAHSLLEEDIIDKEREEEEQQLLRDVNQHDHFTDIIIFSFIIIIPHCIACIILNMSGNSSHLPNTCLILGGRVGKGERWR
jgi:hypothetical protein